LRLCVCVTDSWPLLCRQVPFSGRTVLNYPRNWKAPSNLATDASGVNHCRCSNHYTAGLISDASVRGVRVVNTENDGSKRRAIAANGTELLSCIVPESWAADGNIWNVNAAL
jgi:hypothetical protein